MIPTRLVAIGIAPLLCGALVVTGCPPEYEPAAQAQVLTSDPLLDAGTLSVGDRKTLGLELRSEGPAPVTVKDVSIAHEGDQEAFVLLPWEEDDDGSLVLAGGSKSTPTIHLLQLSYRPEQAGAHRAKLTITSTDTQVEDGQWVVALRGLARHPCAGISPAFVDFGPQGAGSYATTDVQVHNCGGVPLTITGYELGDSTSFTVTTDDPVYVEPAASETLRLAWGPADEQPDGATIGLLTSDPERDLAIEVVGNDCEASVDPAWDADGDGWFVCGGDCDDTDPEVSPSSMETRNHGDDDCDGEVDEDADTRTDVDGDGWDTSQGDCDDADETVHPEATETIDNVDEDCDGTGDEVTDRYDDDGDGLSEREGDCDDADANVHPGAEEAVEGVDDDCDGLLDEGSESFDDDGDGWSEDEGDCDDADPWAYPEASEDCDEVDNDCDGETDEEDACAYLSERTVDTGLGEPEVGCASVGGRCTLSWAGLWGLLGLCVRRRGSSLRPANRSTGTR